MVFQVILAVYSIVSYMHLRICVCIHVYVYIYTCVCVYTVILFLIHVLCYIFYILFLCWSCETFGSEAQ